jgi:UDP-N-acetylglucosamine 3-dehydrogenase
MTLRLGLIGRGRWGRNIERTLLSFPDTELVTIARGQKVQPEFDAVLVATPSASHAEVSLPYIEAGIATFIEKPIATSLTDANRICSAARKSGALVFVGHIFLYNPAFRAALQLLPELGAIEYVICEGANNNPRTDSSVLWDWLPHDLSMARVIFNRNPDSVTACRLSGLSMPTAAFSKFQFGDAAVISTISWVSALPTKRMTVVCKNGTLIFDDKAERRLALYTNKGEISYPRYPDEFPLNLELKAFLQAVRSGRVDPPHLDFAVDIVRAIAAAEQSTVLRGQCLAI